MVIIYNTLINYEFKNDIIKNEFESKKEYYYLGFQSVEYLICKNIYNYLVRYQEELDFCCNFTLLQKIVKKISSKEYFKRVFNDINEKYIYSFIGAVILDDNLIIEDVIDRLFKIESYLLTIYKKEDNKYLFVEEYLNKNEYNITSTFNLSNDVNCTCCIVELNHYFNNSAKSKLEAKYTVLEEIADYLIENKLYYNIKEIVGEYNTVNATDKLELLYEKGYINKPNYFFVTHDQYETVKYEVRCSIEGFSFYSVKINNEKELAKSQSSYAMLEMIILQYNT